MIIKDNVHKVGSLQGSQFTLSDFSELGLSFRLRRIRTGDKRVKCLPWLNLLMVTSLLG